MGLVGMKACPSCGNEIAKNAKRCPHCGRNEPFILRKLAIAGIIWAIVILVGVIAISSMKANSSRNTNNTSNTIRFIVNN